MIKPSVEIDESPLFNLLTMVSHELRTPLTAILGYADIISSDDVDDPKELKRYMEVIQQSAISQAQVIDDLMDATNILSNHLNLEMRPVDLIAVASRVLVKLLPDSQKRNITMEFRSLMNSAKVIGDEKRLEQVFQNLISNAIKFSHQWGKVTVQIESHDDAVEFEIRDNGIGIAPEALKKIFGLFVQADSSLTRRYGGLGLGLAITKYLMEAHGGNIYAESAGLGCGATFRGKLPALGTNYLKQ